MTEPIVDNILNVTNDSIPHVVAEVVSDSTLHNINSLMETAANNTAFGYDNEELYYKGDIIKFQSYLNETTPKRKSFHVQKLYKGNEDAFFKAINNDIKIECGSNKNGSTKIYMIPIS